MPIDVIRVNASLLAHIGADAESLGSGYEGNTFQSTTGYLSQYLNTLPPESTTHLTSLKTQFEALAAREEPLITLRHEGFYPPAYKHYIDTLSNDIKTLPVGETYLLPGGWQTGSGGHAMLYRFKKTDKDTLIFEVVQSGAGIGYHEQHSSIEKELYTPLKSFSINLKTLAEETFETELPLFVERLIRPNLPNHPDHPHSNFSKKTLYEEILPSISFLEGVEFVSDEVLEHDGYTGSQLSGTCAERVIHQLLKFQFESLEAYQQFILNYKIYALNDYLEKHPSHPDLALVEDTYRNNLRLYGRLLVKNAVTESEQDAIEANIDVARQRIAVLKKNALEPSHIPANTATSAPNTDYIVDTTGRVTDVPTLSAFTASAPTPVKQATPISRISAQSFFSEIVRYERIIQQLNHEKEYEVLLEQTKLLMLAVSQITPLPNLSKEDRNTLQTTLKRLRESYRIAEKTCFGESKTLPEGLFVHLSLNLLDIRLFQQTYGTSQFPNLIQQKMENALSKLREQPYLASTHPALDMAFARINRINSRYTSSTLLDCYQAVIHEQSNFKKQLQAKYDALPDYLKPTPTALRQALEREGQQALWYALQYKDDLKTDTALKDMMQPILAMQSIEENVYLFHRASQQRSSNIRSSTFRLDQDTNTLVFDSALDDLQLWFVSPPENHPVYPLEKNTLQSAVFSIHEQARAENDIQLKAYQKDFADWKKGINKTESLQLRELYHLRIAPEAQVDLTLDYFLRHLASLRDANMQQYLEANLFQPPLLSDCLDKSHDILTPFYELIDRGIRSTSKNGHPSQDSIVFIRLYFLLSRYLDTYNAAQFGDRLDSFQKDIDAMLNSHLEDKHIQYSLHQYRFLTSIDAYERRKPLDYQNLITSYFFLQAHDNPKQTQSLQSTYELRRAFKTCQSIIQTHLSAEKIEAYLPHVLAAMDIDTSSLRLEKMGKTFVFKNPDTGTIQYRIDTHHGLIYRGAHNQALIPTPLSIKANPQCIALGLHQTASCLTSANKDYFYFERADGDVRVIKNPFSQKLLVQKKWTINGREAWYEQRIAVPQQGYVSFSEIGFNFPKILCDNTLSNWVKCDAPHDVLITQHNTPILFANSSGILRKQPLTFKDIDPETHHTTNITLLSNPAHQKCIAPLLQFEDAEFLTAFFDKSTGIVEVRFERYGFSVQYNNNDSSNTIHLTGTPYTLCNNPSLFSKHVACLTFEHRTGEDEVSKKCILPIQPFLLASNTSGSQARNVLIQDIAGTQQAKCAAKIKTATDDALPFNHHLSEQFIELPLDKTGAPYAGNCADALYLTYVYLAANQPGKALETLAHCQNNLGGLRGTTQELTYLHWINHQLGDISNPRIVACQLRATALLTEFLNQGKSIPAPDDAPPDIETGNTVYQKAQQKEQQAFLSALPAYIEMQFSTYQRMLRHMPSTFKLGDNEAKSLLTYFKRHSVARPHGTLAYTAQMLDLKTLKKELVHLNSLKEAGQALSSNQTERLSTLEHHIASTEAVAKQTSHLIEDTVDLELPETCEKFRIDYPAYFNESCTKYVFKALTSDLDEDTFKAYFGLFLATAQNDQLTPEQKKAYTLFCTRMLRQYRFSKTPKEVSTQLLMNLLYRVLTSNERLDTPHDPSMPDVRTRAGQVLKPVSLKHIFSQIKNWDAPPNIPFLNIKNVHEAVLQTPEEMLATLDKAVQPKHPLSIERTVTPHLSLHTLLDDLGERFTPFKTTYLDNQASHEDALNALRAQIARDTPHNALFEIEKEAGRLELALFNTQNSLAETYFHNQKTTLENLQASTGTALATCETDMEDLWDTILKLANRPPDNTAESPNKRKVFEFEVEAGERQLLGERELYSLYIQGDLVRYTEKTNLSEADISTLHQHIHQYLHHKLHKQHLERLDKKLNDAIKTPKNPYAIRSVVQQLMQENTPDAVNNTAYTFLQYEENILLRKNQVAALKSLYPDPETLPKESVEKLIMGGGKSTVILPLWAKQKADGSNLVILEVPRALLHSNHADMNQTSFKWFGQRAHKFEFARESDSSPEALERLYHFFRHVMTNKDYIDTTCESMQSLQLKYLEILDRKPEATETDAMLDWERQVQSMDNILNLLKSHGYAMIDEVHQGLLTKQKLNYTSGEDLRISPFLIDANVKFYQFLSPIQWTNPEGETFTLATLIKHPRLVKGDDEWQNIVETICTTLIETRDGPLKRIFDNYPNLTPQQIKAYIQSTLTGAEETEVMAVINGMLPEDNTLLAFYKTELKTQKGVFKQTASRQHLVNYGPSTLEGKTPQERAVAIPYGGNDSPRETSRFADINESMNYTTQAMLITGIQRPLVIDLIRTWQNDAEAEYRQLSAKKKVSYDATNAATIFRDLMKESPFALGLGEVDPESDEHIDVICKTLQESSWITYQILQNYILPQITFNEETLSSNAYHHADMYHSVHGVSGTPANHKSFHQRMHYNPKVALGSDGLIIGTALAKDSQIHAIDYETPHQFLDDLFNTTNKHLDVSAIIDVCAMFQGQKNLDVATQIATKLHQSGSKVQYVLYFDNEVLCAKPCDVSKAPIRLGTTKLENINQILNCTPEERFTYYDQVHTTGTDIKQGSTGRGLVLVDHKTPLTSTLQGTMRMRDFIVGEQSVDYVVPPSLTEYAHTKEHLGNLDALIGNMAKNEANSLSTENFVSTLEKITATVRKDILDRILAIPNAHPHAKHAMHEKVRAVFFEKHKTNYFAQYGGLIHEEDARRILERHKANILAKWDALLERIDTSATPTEHQTLESMLQDIIEDILPHCDPIQLSSTDSQDESAENELELHEHAEAEHEALREEAFADPTLTKQPYYPPRINNLGARSISTFGAPVFSENLKLSTNFSNTYIEQGDTLLNAFMKPAHVILFSGEGNQLTATLITNQEFQDLLLDLPFPNHLWFSDLQGNCLAGNKPKHIEPQDMYQSLMEQTLFFNGDLEPLMQHSRFFWLDQETDKKIAFFETKILPYRESTRNEVNRFKQIFKRANHLEIYDYISEHLDDLDLVHFNFKSINPEVYERDIALFQALIETLQQIKIGWKSTSLPDAQTIMLKHRFPTQVFTCVKKHCETLKALEEISKHSDLLMDNQYQAKTLQTLCRIFKTTPEALAANYAAHPDTHLSPKLYCLTQLLKSPYMQDRKDFMAFFLKDESLTPKELIELIEKKPIETIADEALNILIKRLNSVDDSDAAGLTENESLIDSLIHSPTFSALANQLLDIKKGVTETQFERIIEGCDVNNCLQKIFEHPCSNPDKTMLHLLNHPALDEHSIVTIMMNQRPSYDIMQALIQHPKFGATAAGVSIGDTTLPSHILKQLIDKFSDNEALVLQILRHPNCELDTLVELAQKKPHTAIADEALNILIKRLNSVDDSDAAGLTENESLIDSLIHSPTFSALANQLLDIKKGVTETQFERIIEGCDVNNCIDDILVHPLCTDATVLHLLANPILNEASLDSILMLRHPLTPDIIQALLQHQSINEAVAYTLLNDGSLTSNLLQQIVGKFPHDETLIKRVLKHSNCEADTLAYLFQLENFNASLANSMLVAHQNLAHHVLIQLVKLPQMNIPAIWNTLNTQPHFDTDVAREMLKAHQNLGAGTLTKLIGHPSIDLERIGPDLCAHPNFSANTAASLFSASITLNPDMLKLIMSHANVDINIIGASLFAHPNFHVNMALSLLQQRNDLSAATLKKLSEHAALLTPEVINALIQHLAFDATVSLYLLTTSAVTLDEAHIQRILDRDTTEAVVRAALTHPQATSLTAQHLLEHHNNLSTPVLQSIIKRQNFDIETIVAALLPQANFNTKMGVYLLKAHPDLDTTSLNKLVGSHRININECLTELLQHASFTTETAIHLLITHHDLSTHTLETLILQSQIDINGIIDALLNHPHFDTDLALCLLETHPHLSSDILTQLIRTPQVVTDVIRSKVRLNAGYNLDVAHELSSHTARHAAGNVDVIIKLLQDDSELSAAELKEILNRYNSHTKAIAEALINHPNFNTELALTLLRTDNSLEASTLSTIMQCHAIEKHRIATTLTTQKHFSSHIAQTLLKNEPLLTSAQLVQIVQSSRYEKIIPAICQHGHCNDDVFKAILKKYSDIPLDPLNQMMNETKDHSIFFDALTHKNHTQAEKDKRTKSLKEKTDNAFKKAAEHQDQKLMLFALIQKLEQKSYYFSLQAMKNPKKYTEASKVSFTLHHTLRDTAGAYYRNEIDDAKFLKESKQALEAALPEMQKHRGHKQLLYDIANCIAFILCIGRFILSGGQKLRFFEAKTDTQKTLIDIEKNISSNKPDAQS
ncbi:MAG: DUF3638 domain-containing protein [Legionellaceae bacterium]|nr:DUF3638 domain-containing protein [Legionellaceae bacterium]